MSNSIERQDVPTAADIDWANAPEGATHCLIKDSGTAWFRFKDDNSFPNTWKDGEWKNVRMPTRELTPKPKQPKQLTQAVFNGLSSEYRWAAVDANGKAWAFIKKPVCDDLMFCDGDDAKSENVGVFFDTADWQNSLIERVLICDAETLEPLADQAAAEIERLQAEVERLDQCIGELRLELSKCQERNDELCIASHNQTVKISKIRKVISEN